MATCSRSARRRPRELADEAPLLGSRVLQLLEVIGLNAINLAGENVPHDHQHGMCERARMAWFAAQHNQ